MRREQLPIAALPAWSKLNDVSFIDISIQDFRDSKGSGLITSRALSSKDTYDIPTLLIIPHDLILLFLLMQITIASPAHAQNVGVQNPWTEYCKILPNDIPVPTLWSEEERIWLVGTSLEVCLWWCFLGHCFLCGLRSHRHPSSLKCL